jgi:branched-chain amino acid transport system ATP-binding protein
VALLELSGVSKTFDSLTAISDIDLRLSEAEALGVIGPNGAGKTTLFNVITGDVTPNSGDVIFAGRSIAGLDPAERCRLGLGRTYQIPHPFGGMTVYENVLVGATFGDARSEAEGSTIALEVLERTGLIGKANSLAGGLPLLDRKRLELARALATGPRVLLLDEIAGGLTEREVEDLIRVIKDLRAGGLSIIWIEHVVHALIAVVDRLVAISSGRLLMEGEPKAVMASREVREVYLGISGE